MRSQLVATLAAMGLAAGLADVVGPRLIFVGAGVVGIVAAAIAVPAIRDE